MACQTREKDALHWAVGGQKDTYTGLADDASLGNWGRAKGTGQEIGDLKQTLESEAKPRGEF